MKKKRKIPTPSRFSFPCCTFDRPWSSSGRFFHPGPPVHSDVWRFSVRVSPSPPRVRTNRRGRRRTNEWILRFVFLHSHSRRRTGFRFFCFSLLQLVFAPFHLRLSHVHTDEIWDEIFNWKQEMVMRSFPDERRSKQGRIFFRRWMKKILGKTFSRRHLRAFCLGFQKISRADLLNRQRRGPFASTLSQYFLFKITEENRTKKKKVETLLR